MRMVFFRKRFPFYSLNVLTILFWNRLFLPFFYLNFEWKLICFIISSILHGFSSYGCGSSVSKMVGSGPCFWWRRRIWSFKCCRYISRLLSSLLHIWHRKTGRRNGTRQYVHLPVLPLRLWRQGGSKRMCSSNRATVLKYFLQILHW